MNQSNPKYLYKILSLENFRKSEEQENLFLHPDDKAFIHFSMEDQLPRIQEKYWSGVSECLVLTIDVSKLVGDLVFEANPGGERKYYHLYDGRIRLNAISSKKIVMSIDDKSN